MLSIITSSYKQEQFESFSKNIKETIGIPYEIIQVWNPGKMGITQAYNQGATKAKYNKLLFIHEDVEFTTQNWGEILLNKYFTLPDVGVIGLAGSKKKFNYPSGFVSGNDSYDSFFVDHLNYPPLDRSKNQTPIPIKILDGVFLAMKKEVWEDIKFNEFYQGFHFYDLDITLRASTKFNNYVVGDIGLLHLSEGNFGNDWIKTCFLFHKQKYNFDIPEKSELKHFRKLWYCWLSREKISLLNRIKFVFKMGIDRFSKRAMLGFLFNISNK